MSSFRSFSKYTKFPFRALHKVSSANWIHLTLSQPNPMQCNPSEPDNRSYVSKKFPAFYSTLNKPKKILMWVSSLLTAHHISQPTTSHSAPSWSNCINRLAAVHKLLRWEHTSVTLRHMVLEFSVCRLILLRYCYKMATLRIYTPACFRV
jgi:hypothetical protein